MDSILVENYNRDFQDLASPKHEMSIEDKKWLGIVQNGIRNVNGRYEIPLPLCDNIRPLPETRTVALRRMNSLRKMFTRDPNYAKQYEEFISEMLEKGYAEPVVDPEKVEGAWYIPHFGVRHVDKPGKVRVVFDCAFKVDGISLNDIILQGPDMMNSLLGVLINFRGGYSLTLGI